MKRIVILLCLIFCSLNFAATNNPVLQKDPYFSHLWYVYVPMDSDGKLWARYDFQTPNTQLTAQAKYFILDQIIVGQVREGYDLVSYGKLDCTEGNTGGGGGSWVNSATYGWNNRVTSVTNDYEDYTIPSGCDRIHLNVFNVATNGGLVDIAWDDGTTTGLDITAYNQSVDSKVHELVVATNANAGAKKLRIKNISTDGTKKTLRILGVKCWNSSSDGDPSTTKSGAATLSAGHSIITKFADLTTSLNTGGYKEVITGADSTVQLLTGHGSTIDWAMRWCDTASYDDGAGLVWSGGQNHWDQTGMRPYMYHAGSDYLTDGVDIYVDGVDSGGATALAMNSLLTGGSIQFRSTGFLDLNNEDTEDANEPDVTWTYNFSPNGFSESYSIIWNADCTVNVLYGVMLNPPLTTGLGRVTFPPDRIEYLDNVDTSVTGANAIRWVLPASQISVQLTTQGPMNYTIFDSVVGAATKIYPIYRIGAMSGGMPSSGDVWTFGGNIDVKSLAGTQIKPWFK
jgi:hypothetical protein